jgi:hypothetical protein
MNLFTIAREMFEGHVRGTNPEYERAVIEFLGEAIGFPSESWERLTDIVWESVDA